MTDAATDPPADTAPQPSALRPWQKGGPTPNPKGRGKNVPNKFSAQLVADFAADRRRSDARAQGGVDGSLPPYPARQTGRTECWSRLTETRVTWHPWSPRTIKHVRGCRQLSSKAIITAPSTCGCGTSCIRQVDRS